MSWSLCGVRGLWCSFVVFVPCFSQFQVVRRANIFNGSTLKLLETKQSSLTTQDKLQQVQETCKPSKIKLVHEPEM